MRESARSKRARTKCPPTGEARAKGHRTIAVVSHGAMIRTWAATRATNLTLDFLRTTSLENTLVVDLADAADGSWQVTRWGDKTP